VIEGLTPYREYADSGLLPIGAIPSHWQTLRAKHLFREVDERSVTGKETLLSVSHISGVRRRSELNANTFLAKSNAGHKLCQPNDLVINTMWAWMGALGVSPHPGVVSPAYGVYRPQQNGPLLPAFVGHILRTSGYVTEYTMRSSGIHSSRLRLYPESFLRISLIVPPPDEQAAIVRFLDHANRRIDRFIRAKRKLIALLNEQKQAIIHHAVTRGLAPNIPMKDSGVPWLGKVPAHWNVLRAKHLFREVDERSQTGAEELLSVSHITGVTRRSEKNVTMFKARSYAGHKVCRPGDLVINTMWAWMAALGVSSLHGIVSPAYAVYRPLPESALSAQFADALLRTPPYVSNYICRSTGIQSSRLRLYPDQFFRISIIVPPPREQQSILEWTSGQTAALSLAIGQTERQISIIREYQTRLVADVVTGQLDVREAAARLPDDQPETGVEELASEADQEEDIEPEEMAE